MHSHATHLSEAVVLQSAVRFESDAEDVAALRLWLATFESALIAVATPARRDGTHNLSRHACQRLAQKALDDYHASQREA